MSILRSIELIIVTVMPIKIKSLAIGPSQLQINHCTHAKEGAKRHITHTK